MSDKTDLIYDLVSKIDERQRVKALSDAERHAEEASRMDRIEEDLREHKEGVIQNRARIGKLEEDKKFISKLVGLIMTVSGVLYALSRWI